MDGLTLILSCIIDVKLQKKHKKEQRRFEIYQAKKQKTKNPPQPSKDKRNSNAVFHKNILC